MSDHHLAHAVTGDSGYQHTNTSFANPSVEEIFLVQKVFSFEISSQKFDDKPIMKTDQIETFVQGSRTGLRRYVQRT
jgi:hypothetical protein